MTHLQAAQAAMDDRTLSLELRSRRVSRADGETAVDLTVRCPVRGCDVPLQQCLGCERCNGIGVDRASGNATVECHGDDEAEARGAQVEAPRQPDRGPASVTPISEIMAKHVVCVRSDLDARALAALFLERGISGAPVVDDDARPIGIVSKTDLVRDHHEERPPGSPARTVADIMMPVAFCLPANESIARAAALMAFEGVHRVPVVGTLGQVVGLVSPLDVLRWLAREHGYVLGGSR